MRALLCPLLARSAWAQPATVLAGTTRESAVLASVRLVGVGQVIQCGGVLDRLGHSSGLRSLGRRGSSQPLRWRARQLTALMWTLFARQRGLSQPLWWRTRQVRLLLWPLFGGSSWTQPATVEAYTTVEGAALASVRLVGVGQVSQCGGGHDR
jgi:hypothetical protein